MCGRLNITDNPFVTALLDELNVTNRETFRTSEFVRATDTISIVREVNGERQLDDATWWLLLEPSEKGGFKPSRYTSFNTRYDKLNVKGSAGYHAYREQRCLIVASGFGETEFEQRGNRKVPVHYHNFYAIDSALAFAGLYRQWVDKSTGESQFSTSVITLPSHEKIRPFHSKASPMMLSPQGEQISQWLSASTDILQFDEWLLPKIYNDLSVVPIKKPSDPTPLAPAQLITRD
ncbi:SOS response-associated peptidase family protein [Thalassotalea fusca]